MTEHDQNSPYTRSFTAAAIVIGAVLLCGTLLLLTSPGNNSPTADAAPTTPADQSEPPAPAERSEGATIPTPAPPSAPASALSPAAATSTPATSPAASPTTPATDPNACNLPAGNHSIPTDPPPADTWEVTRRAVVPRSKTYGPTTTDQDGFRRCFAHSPTGALYAAYNAIAALNDQHQAVTTTKKLMLPGPNTDALLRELRSEKPSDSEAVQVAGYRILDATQDRITVVLALPVEQEYMSATLTLVWHHDDWRVVPPNPGDQFGAPYSQHRDLDDFVTWRGL